MLSAKRLCKPSVLFLSRFSKIRSKIWLLSKGRFIIKLDRGILKLLEEHVCHCLMSCGTVLSYSSHLFTRYHNSLFCHKQLPTIAKKQGIQFLTEKLEKRVGMKCNMIIHALYPFVDIKYAIQHCLYDLRKGIKDCV